MKVELHQRPYDGQRFPWKKSLPFHVNPRGMLIHRVRSVETIRPGTRRNWEAIHYYCGNGVCGSGHDLTDDPPKSRILCARCEAIAKQLGHPSADEIVGRHIHVGGVRPYRTCCKEQEQ